MHDLDTPRNSRSVVGESNNLAIDTMKWALHFIADVLNEIPWMLFEYGKNRLLVGHHLIWVSEIKLNITLMSRITQKNIVARMLHSRLYRYYK